MFSALKKLVGSEPAPGRDKNIPAGLQSMNQALQRRFAKGVQYNSECGGRGAASGLGGHRSGKRRGASPRAGWCWQALRTRFGVRRAPAVRAPPSDPVLRGTRHRATCARLARRQLPGGGPVASLTG